MFYAAQVFGVATSNTLYYSGASRRAIRPTAVALEADRQKQYIVINVISQHTDATASAAAMQLHGPARALRAVLRQEGWAMAMAGCSRPALDAEDLAYTRAVIEPHLDAHDMPTLVACLFGDGAARSLGYTPQGLSERAGLALARHDALNQIRAEDRLPDPAWGAGHAPQAV
jgi:hypothetical protein